MKKYFLLCSLLIVMVGSFGQTKSKPKEKPSSEMDKAMEEAMKGMSEEEKAEMRKMMKDVMPELEKKPVSTVVAFSDNKKLIPVKDVNRIKAIPKKIFSDAELNANTTLLYNKLIAKIRPGEKKIITEVLSEAKTSSTLMDAAITAFLQGHGQAAMGLAMKAVQADPKNVNCQNNLAAILSQSGYPEQAIPYLRKLSSQFPTNGTVLHNLGYAWLSLGEIDTARRFFGYAAVRNPGNPETMLCRGLIEELRGNPKKAADHYVESFEHAPNPFTENLAKNVKAENRLEKIDFDKLKSRIAIHEYFKKDWIKIPAMVDNVSAYEANMRIKNGYQQMFEQLDNNIDTLLDASGQDIQELAEKGEDEFIKTMMKETIKGFNMMSKPAMYIEKILTVHMHKWNERYVRELDSLMKAIRVKQDVMTKSGKNDKCPDFDRKNDEFMKYANPLIRKFYAKKIEECRVWLNALCTWSWYLAGNPRNTVLTQCITWTSYFTKLYQGAVNDQYAFAKSCVKQDGDGIAHMQVPAVPNFTCPAVVSIPVGMNALRLSAETINFDDNHWKIKHSESANTPNTTLSLGIDKEHITEPGKYGNPYAKTGDGSMTTSGINYAKYDDAELTPLSKILDELTPLSKLPLDELAPLDPSLLNSKKLGKTDLQKILSAQAARKFLKEMMSTKCPGKLPPRKPEKAEEKFDPHKIIYHDGKTTVFASGFTVTMGEVEFLPTFEVGFGEIEFEDAEPAKDGFKVGLGELELWDEDMQAWINTKGEKRYEEGFKEKLIKDVREALTTSGIQSTISNGLEGLRSMNNVDRGLFDK